MKDDYKEKSDEGNGRRKGEGIGKGKEERIEEGEKDSCGVAKLHNQYCLFDW